MKKIGRLVSIILAIVMALSMLAGCQSEEKTASGALPELDGRYEVDASKPAYQLDTKENTKLTWYVNADWWNTDWANDTVTKKIKEDLGLDIEFLTGDDTKLNTLFAGYCYNFLFFFHCCHQRQPMGVCAG